MRSLIRHLACGLVLAAAIPCAHAQTCASPQAWMPPTAGEALQGTTCGGDTTASSYCAGNQSAPGPAYVFTFTMIHSLATFTAITLSGGNAGFDPVMYMSALADGCGTNAACGPSGDAGFPIAAADIADGDWYLIVTAAGIDAVGACGAFSIDSSGSYPVELRSFDVT